MSVYLPQRIGSLLAVLFLILCSNIKSYAQDPCGCEQQESIKLCYLATEDYCDDLSFIFNCEYSLDGDFMQPGLVQKLLNPSNFGPNGNSCGIELKQLPPITGVETIETCDCDIVFIGQFPAVSGSEPDLSNSSVPESTLETIREWSMDCESNLVITTQAEANPWGYITENLNFNPNIPVAGVSISIFDGPFGSLNQFLQGGSFQGVFTQIPGTGAEILAEDASGRPTIVLDNATNDIILADVGILCSGGAGSISTGGTIINNNDILACNLFALGCNIAEGVKFEEAVAEICPGDSTILPDGTFASLPGLYLDTLEAANGCDSIIETEIQLIDQLSSTFSPPLCEDDDFSITINGNVYDINNTQGEELLISQGGCDSIVTVDLFYAPHTTNMINAQQCNGDGFSVDVGGVIYNEANPVGTELLINQFGCDSTVTIDLHFEPVDTTLYEFERCEGDTLVFEGVTYMAGTTTNIYFADATSYCDSTIIVDVTAIPLPFIETDSSITITQGDDYTFDYVIPPGVTVEWSPAQALSCIQCPSPSLLPNQFPGNFQLKATDESGCSSTFDIFAQYICQPYIPNAFSPNGDGRNDRFRVYNTCPIEGFEIAIFNRWGAMVYQSEDINSGWDGLYLNQPSAIGVYVYAVTIKENGGEKVISGEVNLLR
jgi:gliding motility-associated-like protein